jgi:hypothetical protein
MTVPGRDPGDELRQLVTPPGWAQDDAAVTVEGQRNAVSFTDAGLFGYRKGNSDSEAVPPLRNGRYIAHAYLL